MEGIPTKGATMEVKWTRRIIDSRLKPHGVAVTANFSNYVMVI